MSPRAIIKCLAFCLRMAVKMKDATMKRRNGVFKGKSRLLYSPRQCWHDVCVCCGSGRTWTGGRHFWLYPDRNKRGTSRGVTGVTNYSAVCRVAPSVRGMACE